MTTSRNRKSRERTKSTMAGLLMTAMLLFLTPIQTACAEPVEEMSRDGSKERPLRVMLIPADTGADTTLDDFKPVFKAIEANFGIYFDLRVGTSYHAVVEGLATKRVEIAFVGPVAFHQALQRNAAELLAVGISDNVSSYRAVLLTRADSGIKNLGDLKGKNLALGDINSASSFQFPLAMLVKAKIDPILGLGKVTVTGSHSSALAALREGYVDAAGCSLNALEKAINSHVVANGQLVILAVSPPIPNPPLVMHPALAADVKEKLRDAFRTIHHTPGVTPEMIRGYGGRQYERFDVEFSQKEFEEAVQKLAPVTQEMVTCIVERAADRK